MRYWPILLVFALLAAGCGKKADAPDADAATGVKSTVGKTDRPKYEAEVPPKPGDRSTQPAPNLPKPTVATTPKSKASVDEGMRLTGLPTYPGAKLLDGPDDFTKTTRKGRVTIKAAFTTSDQPGAVMEFYKKQLTSSNAQQRGELAFLSGRTAAGADVVVTAVTDFKNKSLTHFEILISRKQ